MPTTAPAPTTTGQAGLLSYLRDSVLEPARRNREKLEPDWNKSRAAYALDPAFDDYAGTWKTKARNSAWKSRTIFDIIRQKVTAARAVSTDLLFKGGRVVDASAKRGEDFLIKMLDQDAGARTMGEIAIGTNYSITDYSRNTLFDEKIGGTFHAAVGAGYPESGSSNESGLHWDMVCELRQRHGAPGGTIEADGEVFSRNGRFLNGSFPSPD